MNDLVVSCATSIESMRCSSRVVPRVTDTSAWVWPRVNSAEPCVRGSVPTSQLIGRTVSRSRDRKSTRLNSSHLVISYAVFCLKKKKKKTKVISTDTSTQHTSSSGQTRL